MTNNKLFEDVLARTPVHVSKFVAKSMDVADQILAILKAKGWSQKNLADALGKKESEISKWLTGTHNFTLQSIAKIEAILNEDVIIAPMYWYEYKGMYAPAEDTVKSIPGIIEGSSFGAKLSLKSEVFIPDSKAYIYTKISQSEQNLALPPSDMPRAYTMASQTLASKYSSATELFGMAEGKNADEDSQYISICA